MSLLFSLSLLGQTVFTYDQVVLNNDSTLILDKSNNLPITGLLKKYHENSQLSFEGNYINGLKEGLVKEYYKNGALEYEGTYKAGQEGESWGYFKNGTIASKKWTFKGEDYMETYYKNIIEYIL